MQSITTAVDSFSYGILKDINVEAKNFTKKLKIHDRIKKLYFKKAYIMLKDDKEGILVRNHFKLFFTHLIY